jgi:hypothetical protein
VYVFIEPAGGWTSITETAELNVAEAGAHIAYGVATNGSVVVAYPGFVWVEPSGGWANSSVPNAELINSDSQPVGNSVAIDGNVIVLGAPYAYNSYGAAYLYVKPASGWHKIGISHEWEHGSVRGEWAGNVRVCKTGGRMGKHEPNGLANAIFRNL